MKRPTKLFTLAMFSAASAAACAAVLGIDDRKLDPELTDAESGTANENESGSDGPIAFDATTPDVELLPDAACDPSACGDAGGTCVPNLGCSIRCDAGCSTITCPPDQDCRVTCNSITECVDVKCQGGRSCTIDCLSTATCSNAYCTSQTCRINCVAGQTCRVAAACDASVCIVTCKGGKDACENGVNAYGSEYCGISCDGDDVCEKTALSCNASPDASIFCGPTGDPCKSIAPSCDGGYCAIFCDAGVACPKHCCNAQTCDVGGFTAKVCP